MSKHPKKISWQRLVAVCICAGLSVIGSLALTACNSENNGESSNGGTKDANIRLDVSDVPYDPSNEEKKQQALDVVISEKISEMSLRDKISQMIIVRPESISSDMTSFTASGEEKLAEYPFGGVCYFSDNISDAGTLRSAIAAWQDAADKAGAGIPMFISVDEEGGGLEYPDAIEGAGGKRGVVRLAGKELPDVEELYPMFYYKDDGVDTAYSNARKIATYLEDYGFNWDYAPVADTNSNPDNPIIGYRAYSDDYNECAQLVAAAVEGYESQNMATSLKHFPGHGDTKTDSHLGAASVEKTLVEMRGQDLLPFAAGIAAGVDSVMMGHIVVPDVDELPASMSATWVRILRGDLGFDGVIVTDGLEMGALTNTWSRGEIAVGCLQAGCDVLLLPDDPYVAVTAVEAAVEDGTISETEIDEHVERILAMKARHEIWSWGGNKEASK